MRDDDLHAMAARIFGEEPPVAPAVDVERLLKRTEALLNSRWALERALRRGPIEPAEDEAQWQLRMHRSAFYIFLHADRLFADLLGDAVFRTFYGAGDENQSPSEKRAAFSSRLRVFSKLLSEPDWANTLAELTREISDMNGGDLPEVLAPEKRNPGQARQPIKVARLRLRALLWNEHLRAKGLSASERQSAISDAYKATWDSIRKWRNACEETFGSRAVWGELNWATMTEWGEYEEGSWRDALSADGAEYYREWQKQRGGATTA